MQVAQFLSGVPFFSLPQFYTHTHSSVCILRKTTLTWWRVTQMLHSRTRQSSGRGLNCEVVGGFLFFFFMSKKADDEEEEYYKTTQQDNLRQCDMPNSCAARILRRNESSLQLTYTSDMYYLPKNKINPTYIYVMWACLTSSFLWPTYIILPIYLHLPCFLPLYLFYIL